MKSKKVKSKVLEKILVVLVVFCSVFVLGKVARCQTAAVRIKAALEGTITITDIDENTDKHNGKNRPIGCLIDTLEESSFYHASLYRTIDEIVTITATITGAGIISLITFSLGKSSSGYYEGVQNNLPAGAELIFKVEAKDVQGEIIAKGETKGTLEADKITDIVLTIYPLSVDPTNVPQIVLSTSDTDIKPNETATIEITIHDDNTDVSCDISHSSSKGSLSNSGGLISLVNEEATITTILTPDAQGDYTDIITVKVDDQQGGIAINKISIVIQSLPTGSASITVNFAPFIDSITITDNGDRTMNIFAEVSDEDSDSLVFEWGWSEFLEPLEIIGDKDSNPITIKEPVSSTLITLVVTDELNAQSYLDFHISPNNLNSAVEFTFVPQVGSYDNLRGIVKNADPLQHKIVVYIKVDDVWWVKPYDNSKLTAIGSNSEWTCDVTTGGHDQDATQYVAFLIPNTYVLPALTGDNLMEDIRSHAVATVSAVREVTERTISFSGYDWKVKSSSSKLGPGPNYFSDSEKNVWVDGDGYLHLKMIKDGYNWTCSEVVCQENLGYGKYIFYLGSRVDLLDKNAVLGLFTWDTDPDEHNREIDIEFAKWGGQDEFNSQYVIQPYTHVNNLIRFTTDLSSNIDSAHYFDWKSDKVYFKSVLGPDINGLTVINSYDYSGSDVPSPGNAKARMNLWLMNGIFPDDETKVNEVIVKKFEFVIP